MRRTELLLISTSAPNSAAVGALTRHTFMERSRLSGDSDHPLRRCSGFQDFADFLAAAPRVRSKAKIDTTISWFLRRRSVVLRVSLALTAFVISSCFASFGTRTLMTGGFIAVLQSAGPLTDSQKDVNQRAVQLSSLSVGCSDAVERV